MSLEKQTFNLGKAIFVRLFVVSLPGSLMGQFGPRALASSPLKTLSPSEMIIGELLIACLSLFSLAAFFKPKLIIKPAFGAFIFALVSHQIHKFSYSGLLSEIIREGIVISSGLACLYLTFYDFMKFCSRIYLKLEKKFSPAIAPDWAGPFNSTKEKGDALEEYVKEVYRRIYGNAMTTTEMKQRGLIPDGPGDQGADVVVELPNNRRLAIQCKNTDSPMGNSAVQEIMAAKAYYDADELAIVSPRGFTDRCVELAQAQSRHYNTNIHLIDGLRLDELTRIARKNRLKAA